MITPIRAAQPRAMLAERPQSVRPACPSRRRGGVRALAATRAVVLGTGVGGLVAAQRLSKHFDEVVCLERDPLGGDRDAKTLPTKRPGVPQFKHAHGLLGRGGSILDDSFGPDYRSELLAAGGRLVDWHSDLVIHALPGTTFMRDAPGSAPPPGRPPMYMYSATRGLIEGTARKLLERNPKVTVRYGARADGLAFSADKDDGGRPAAVEGVTLAGGGGVVGADLVVDCSGRNSRVADWLGAAGWEAPPVSVVDAGVGYVSRHVRLTLEAQRRLEGIELIAGLPLYPNPQFALMQRMEGGEFMVAMAGFAQDEAAGSPPMVDDVAAINAWAQGVWWPEFNELLCGATALGPPSRFFNLNNVHRRYDAVALPEGLALLGDTVCSFNPVYGQGMTVAAIEAELLDSMIAARLATTARQGAAGSSPRQLLAGLGSQHARESAAVIADAWALAAGLDSVLPWAKGEGVGSWAVHARAAYMTEVLRLCASDGQVHGAMTSVWNMYQPGSILTSPTIALKVAVSWASRAMRSLVKAGQATEAPSAPAATSAARR